MRLGDVQPAAHGPDHAQVSVEADLAALASVVGIFLAGSTVGKDGNQEEKVAVELHGEE